MIRTVAYTSDVLGSNRVVTRVGRVRQLPRVQSRRRWWKNGMDEEKNTIGGRTLQRD